MKKGGASPHKTSEKSRGGRAAGGPPVPLRGKGEPKNPKLDKTKSLLRTVRKVVVSGGGWGAHSGVKSPPKTPKSDRV